MNELELYNKKNLFNVSILLLALSLLLLLLPLRNKYRPIPQNQ